VRLRERPEAHLRPLEIGTLLHSQAELFVKRGMRNAAEIFDGITAAPEYDFLRGGAEGLNLLRRLKEEAVKVCGELARQRELSLFAPELIEEEFPGGKLHAPRLRIEGGAEITLFGRIDRADVWENGGKRYARVLDYKTGAPDSSLSSVALGTNLQLPVYLAALRASGFIPAGAFYFPVHNKEGGDYALDGFINTDDGIPQAMDIRLTGGGAAESDIIKVKLNKDGSFRKSAHCLTGERTEMLIEAGLKLLSAACAAVLRGERAVYPVKNACGYCPFPDVCGGADKCRTVGRIDGVERLAEYAENGGGL
jgi:ATP-dependent helicase/nuclease subunit B